LGEGWLQGNRRLPFRPAAIGGGAGGSMGVWRADIAPRKARVIMLDKQAGRAPVFAVARVTTIDCGAATPAFVILRA